MQTQELVQDLLGKIKETSAKVGVVGLGYVGLPFAVEKAKVGFKVLGFDRSANRVEMVNRGENFIGDVDDEELRSLVGRGFIEATTDMDRLGDMDVLVIAVPTPLNKNLNPDLQYIEAVTRDIAKPDR